MRQFLIAALMCCLATGAFAQRAALKTNVLEWATATPNLGAEFVLGKSFSLNIEGAFNPISTSKLGMRHAHLVPEARWWLGRALSRHFVGLLTGIGAYDVHLNETRHRGAHWVAGLSYGYDFVLSKHWNLELTVAAGYRGYREPEVHHSFAPLKANVSFVYILK